MINNEAYLLYSALCYERGHCRRTQHILKVYALAKLLGEQERISTEEQQILHDIAIKYCKDNYDGDAGQEKQKKEAPHLVNSFLQEANYLPSYIPRILELVVKHHDYDAPKDRTLQILMEADLIINCYENCQSSGKIRCIKDFFQTSSGKKLFDLCVEGIKEREGFS